MMRWGRWVFVLSGAVLLALGLAGCGTVWGNSPTAVPTAPLPPEVTLEGSDSRLNYPAEQPLTLHFSQPMDPRSAATPLYITPTVQGTWAWNADATQLTFTPENGFSRGTAYTVTLNPALASAIGIPMVQSVRWEIQVPTAPTVINCEGLDDQGASQPLLSLTTRMPTLVITFDREMDRAGTLAGLHVSPALALTTTLAGKTLWITPTEPLTPDTLYHFHVDDTAADREGVAMDAPYQCAVRLLPLEMDAEWPADAEHHETLVFRSTYPLDTKSVREQWTLAPSLAGKLTWNMTQTVFSLTVNAPVTPGLPLTLSFRGPLRDRQQVELPEVGPFQLAAPPLILDSPEAAALDPQTPIRVIFSRKMDPAGVEAAFHITPAVTGTFSWAGNVLSFQPAECLNAGAAYTLTLDSALPDAAGTVWLETPYTRTLEIGALAQTAGFGMGNGVQVLDTRGARTVLAMVQVLDAAEEKRPGCLSAALYPLDFEQFRTHVSVVPPVAAPVTPAISGTELPLIARWPITFPAEITETLVNPAVTLPGDIPAGFYELDLEEAGRVSDRLWVALTRHTLLVKQAGPELVVWATEFNGGAAPGMPVTVYDREGQALAEGETDAQGIFRATLPAGSAPALVVAGEGDGATLSGLDASWAVGAAETGSHAQRWRVYAYTDRPIYLLGQELAFKAALWRDGAEGLEPLEAGTPVTVAVRDARGTLVQTVPTEAGAFSTIEGVFPLTDGVVEPGEYYLEIEIDGESHRRPFRIGSPNTAALRFTAVPDRELAVVGEPLTLTISAVGEKDRPAAGVAVKITPLLQVRTGETATFGLGWQSLPQKIEGRTDAAGTFTGTLPITLPEKSAGEFLGFEVVLGNADEAMVRQVVAVRAVRTVERAMLELEGALPQPGVPFTVTARVAGAAGEPVAGRTLTAILERQGGDAPTAIQTATLTTDAEGRAVIPLVVEEPGTYAVRVTGSDRLGNPMEQRLPLSLLPESVSDSEPPVGTGELSIQTERPGYGPGDAARLLIHSPFTGTALLTFERGRVRREQLVELAAPATVVTVPVEPGDGPHVWVTCNAWKAVSPLVFDGSRPESQANDSRLLTARTLLRVPAAGKALSITITPESPAYTPGETATLTIRVADAQGAPVAAEVSVAVVDAASGALEAGLGAPIFDSVYQTAEDGVSSFCTLAPNRFITGIHPGGCPSGACDPGVASSESLLPPRNDFSTRLLWVPALETDAEGVATVAVGWPAQSGRWAVIVRAVTAEAAVGEARLVIGAQ